MSIINTNVMSLNSQRNLATNNASLGTTIQRLSSGLRINSAKDDAAGLAISERFTTQIRGMNQAARNANDGISLAQTAEGALAEIGNNLQRIRELSVQSRNATNSAADRAALDAEAQLLKAEVQRVAEQTTFNGTKLLDGNFMNQAFQVGADQGQIINIAQLANANTADLGNWTSVATAASATGAAATGVTSGGTPVPATSGTSYFNATTLLADFSTNQAAFDVEVDGGVAQTVTLNADFTAGADDLANGSALAAAISGQLTGATAAYDDTTKRVTITSDSTGTSSTIAISNFDADPDGDLTDASVTTMPASTAAAGAAATTTGGTTAFSALTGGDLTINGVNIEVAASGNASQRAAALVKAINTAAGSNSAMTGVSASVVSGGVQIRSATGDIVIAGSSSDLTALTGLTAGTTAGGALSGSTAYAAGSAQVGFASLSIATADGADNAILAMDAALNAVNSARADLGAIQNRFSSVVSNLNTTSENLSASRSRIRDTDFAKETAELTRTQILNQAGTAMLAQANQVPQSVLSLLR